MMDGLARVGSRLGILRPPSPATVESRPPGSDSGLISDGAQSAGRRASLGSDSNEYDEHGSSRGSGLIGGGDGTPPRTPPGSEHGNMPPPDNGSRPQPPVDHAEGPQPPHNGDDEGPQPSQNGDDEGPQPSQNGDHASRIAGLKAELATAKTDLNNALASAKHLQGKLNTSASSLTANTAELAQVKKRAKAFMYAALAAGVSVPAAAAMTYYILRHETSRAAAKAAAS